GGSHAGACSASSVVSLAGASEVGAASSAGADATGAAAGSSAGASVTGVGGGAGEGATGRGGTGATTVGALRRRSAVHTAKPAPQIAASQNRRASHRTNRVRREARALIARHSSQGGRR